MSSFIDQSMSASKANRHPVCKHCDEYSSAIANRSSRHDILDAFNGNGGPIDIGEGPSNGAAPGADGPPTTGGPVGGIQMGWV
jgi:hypothetical protein